jgi:LmbE family N-acetylglucosaminyl deacetylase
MLALLPNSGLRPELNVLCVGAHCDDIDIGCGGALLNLLATHRQVSVAWVVFSGDAGRVSELERSARSFLAQAARREIVTHDFRDGFFPAHYAPIKEAFESLKSSAPPDLIFTHRRDDRHQDHRVVAELTWNTFRDHVILEYEVPKFEGDLTTPNVYVTLSDEDIERKVHILTESYESQRTKRWFTAETFRALARLRGIESNAPSGWAEGFHAPKLLLQWKS